jgi:cardiolipin synthase A/B
MSEKIYHNNIYFFLNLLRSIRKAQHIVSLDTYIFAPDRLGALVFSELKKAAQRGVEVRLNLDGFGSHPFLNSTDLHNLDPRLKVRSYNPPPWPFSRFKWDQLLSISHFFHILRGINRRNHKKVVVIDHSIAFVGSHNIHLQALQWRETSVRIKDSRVIEDLAQILEWSWQKSAPFKQRALSLIKKPELRSKKVYFSLQTKNRRYFLKSLQRRLGQAQTQIKVSTPYFAPPAKIVRCMCQAARRGVAVEIILPARTDVFLFPIVSRTLYKALLSAGVKIYEHQGPLLHAKQVMVDQWITVGSSNMNPRSFFRDLEVEYRISESANIALVQQQFEHDKSLSQRVEYQNLSRSFWHLWLGYLLGRVLRSWL